MDKANDLYQEIKDLHTKYGAAIPQKAFTDEVHKKISDFKQTWIHKNWLDNEFIWAAANMDRYNNNVFGSRAHL